MLFTMTAERQQEERDKVTPMTDGQLLDYITDAIKGSAVLSSRGHGYNSFDQKVDVGYDELNKRGKPNLYTIAFNRAKRDFGL